MSAGSDKPDERFFVLPFIAIWCACRALVAFVNRITVRIDDRRVLREEGPVPSRRGLVEVWLHDVREIAIESRPRRWADPRPRFEVRLRDRWDVWHTLAALDREPDARALADELTARVAPR